MQDFYSKNSIGAFLTDLSKTQRVAYLQDAGKKTSHFFFFHYCKTES